MIDLTPAANPLDIPSPKASDIVRNWPDAMWCADNAKIITGDGHVSFCAVGILAETGGHDWGEHSRTYGAVRIWMGSAPDHAPIRFVAEKHGLSQDQIEVLYNRNGLGGKDAAADYLESLGL